MSQLKQVEVIAQQLLFKHWRIATAESCTGGGLAQLFTELPGSSVWFERGYVTYSNHAKIEDLGVDQELLARYGAVSEETAKAMAEGAQQRATVDIAIAITGIAGPTGGSEEKPVGTVCFGLAKKGQPTKTYTAHFTGNRQAVRDQSLQFCLDELTQLLTG